MSGLMGFQGLIVLLLCFLQFSSASSACRPRRDRETCSARSWKEEYNCYMAQNTLSDLIRCVKTDIKGDGKLCQDLTDDIPDRGNADYFSTKATFQCRSARQILLAGSNYDDCQDCVMRGLIQSCPDNDPNFWNCLCENNITPDHMWCLSRCFKRESVEGLTCPQWEKLKHRGSTSDDMGIQVRDTVALGWKRLDQNTYITIDGMSCVYYKDSKTCVEGWIFLPYEDLFDTEIRRNVRCYVHPTRADTGCFLLSDVMKVMDRRAVDDSTSTLRSTGLASFASRTVFGLDTATATESSWTSEQSLFSVSKASMRTASGTETLSLIQPTPPSETSSSARSTSSAASFTVWSSLGGTRMLFVYTSGALIMTTIFA